MASHPTTPDQHDGEQSSERSLKMQRGVSQLLFNYLPYRTVDWEDGLAIVQLGNVRLSSVWEEDRKTTLLKEIGEAFHRWQARGGRIDPAFPPEQLSPAGTFQPCGLRLRNPKFPLLRVSLSYHVPHGA